MRSAGHFGAPNFEEQSHRKHRYNRNFVEHRARSSSEAGAPSVPPAFRSVGHQADTPDQPASAHTAPAPLAANCEGWLVVHIVPEVRLATRVHPEQAGNQAQRLLQWTYHE